jgi:large subunit ribosomal protein L17
MSGKLQGLRDNEIFYRSSTRAARIGFQEGDRARRVSIEPLDTEHELDEKREKRAEVRAKRRKEIDKAMSESPPPDGSDSHA